MSVAPAMNPSEAVGGRSDRNKRMDAKNKDQMVYMTDQTQIPVYLPYPRFLLGMNLTQTAKVLYALLLDRASLSRQGGRMRKATFLWFIPLLIWLTILERVT